MDVLYFFALKKCALNPVSASAYHSGNKPNLLTFMVAHRLYLCYSMGSKIARGDKSCNCSPRILACRRGEDALEAIMAQRRILEQGSWEKLALW